MKIQRANNQYKQHFKGAVKVIDCDLGEQLTLGLTKTDYALRIKPYEEVSIWFKNLNIEKNTIKKLKELKCKYLYFKKTELIEDEFSDFSRNEAWDGKETLIIKNISELYNRLK